MVTMIQVHQIRDQKDPNRCWMDPSKLIRTCHPHLTFIGMYIVLVSGRGPGRYTTACEGPCPVALFGPDLPLVNLLLFVKK